MTGVDWERLEAFERSWDGRLGGESSRPYRDLACYCMGKLLASGASFDDAAEYFRATYEQLKDLLRPPAGAS